MLRRPTAVKLLETRESGAIERFEREVQLTSQLSHPNTIAIYDYGRTPEGFFYYAMEYIEGIDLAELIKIEGPVPPSRVVHILRQVCGSLAEAHAQGFVHRDIKPSNVMLSMRGEPDVVKVLDFGLVKRVDRDQSKMLTTMGVVFGTPGFIPPETLRIPPSSMPGATSTPSAWSRMSSSRVTASSNGRPCTRPAGSTWRWIPSGHPSASAAQSRPLSRPWSWRVLRRTRQRDPRRSSRSAICSTPARTSPLDEGGCPRVVGDARGADRRAEASGSTGFTRLEAPGQHSATRHADRRQRLDNPRVIPAG